MTIFIKPVLIQLSGSLLPSTLLELLFCCNNEFHNVHKRFTLAKLKGDKEVDSSGIDLYFKKSVCACYQHSWAGRLNKADPYFEILDH
jgi:hypothetical protein